MTNSQKIQILNKAGYKLNPFAEAIFDEKAYYIPYSHPVVRVGKITHFDGLTMDHIRKQNQSIIKQSELDMVNSEVELKNLIKSKQ
jgi:hypothetical protein